MRHRSDSAPAVRGAALPAAAALSLILCLPAATRAVPIQLSFSSTSTTSTEDTGVSGRIDISFVETPDGDFCELVITNTGVGTEAGKLTAVGLTVPSLPFQPVFAPGGQGSYFDELDYDVLVSPDWLNPPGGYDLMVTSDGSFEGGSPQGALGAGESQTVTLFLGDTSSGPDDFRSLFESFYDAAADPVAIGRFQSIGPQGLSDKVITPEPHALLLMTCLAPLITRRRPSRP